MDTRRHDVPEDLPGTWNRWLLPTSRLGITDSLGPWSAAGGLLWIGERVRPLRTNVRQVLARYYNPRLRVAPVLMHVLLGLLAIGNATESHGAESEVLYSLHVPIARVAPGSRIEVQLAALNRGPGDVAVAFPPTLTGQLRNTTEQATVELRAEDATGTQPRIAAGSFAVRSYILEITQSAAPGLTTLDVSLADAGVVRSALEVDATAPSAPRIATTRGAQRPVAILGRSQPAAAALRQTFINRLDTHEPIYFIYGPDAPAAKFQFSFKYKLLEFGKGGPQRMTRTLQFGFTQRSLWDIDADSSPFYDTSYMPEIIYQALAPEPDRSDGWLTWLGWQAAYKHESNGRDGPISRSLNVVYVRSGLALGRLDGWHLIVAPELFAYVGTLGNNPGIDDYRGYGRLQLVLGRTDGPALAVTTWAGKNFDHASVQLDLTLPVRTRLLNFGTYFLVQYFTGYGESLLSYRTKSETVRAGISFVR